MFIKFALQRIHLTLHTVRKLFVNNFSRALQNLLRIINTIASVLRESVPVHFPLTLYSVKQIYLFLEVHSFPRASLSVNCSHNGTDNVRGQISVHIFAPHKGYWFYIVTSFCFERYSLFSSVIGRAFLREATRNLRTHFCKEPLLAF